MRTGGEDRFSKLEENRNDDYEDDNYDGLSCSRGGVASRLWAVCRLGDHM